MLGFLSRVEFFRLVFFRPEFPGYSGTSRSICWFILLMVVQSLTYWARVE